MAYPFTLDDVRFLASTAGRDALAAADSLTLTEDALLADLTKLRRTVGERSAAVAETTRLRRRAITKLGEAGGRWLFTDESLQQASPAVVSAHRAARLRGLGVHDLTCSIGTDVAFLDAVCPVVVGSDLDPVRLLMARHNLGEAGVPARLVAADALTRCTRGLLGYADPARRDRAGRRITSVSTVPTVAELDAAHRHRPLVLRLPPGVDYDELNRPGEVEIVSLDGAAREAVLWPVELAGTGRRATVLSSASDPVAGTGNASYELTSDDPDETGVGPIGDWLVDPDPAVVRAHLVRHYATRHGLVLLDPHLAYMTGPLPPPGIRAFQVLDAAPYRERTVADWARRDGVGTLEIKQRGTPVIPDELRTRLRQALRGPKSMAATLVIARVGSQPQAFWCRAVDPR